MESDVNENKLVIVIALALALALALAICSSMNHDDLITPAQHTHYCGTFPVHHAPSRTRTVLFENFNADDPEHDEPDIEQDIAADIGHHGRIRRTTVSCSYLKSWRPLVSGLSN